MTLDLTARRALVDDAGFRGRVLMALVQAALDTPPVDDPYAEQAASYAQRVLADPFRAADAATVLVAAAVESPDADDDALRALVRAQWPNLVGVRLAEVQAAKVDAASLAAG